ncbi:MAG: hypothetical protein JZD41_03465 [Thermoproteus sp.]|nr:hypothetical protein [Thermoproteus sp.]
MVDPRPYHEFRLGIPMAFAGLLDFDDLVFYYSGMKRVVHVRDDVVKAAKDGVYTSSGSRLRGGTVVLAVDAVRIGPPSFSTVEEAELSTDSLRAPAPSDSL